MGNPICFFILVPLHLRWRWILIKIMHLVETFIVPENSYSEGLYNNIVYIFDVVLKYGPVLTPRSLYQLKTQLIIKVDAIFWSTYGLSVHINNVYLSPISELFHSHTLIRLEGPHISGQPTIWFLTLQQHLSKKSALILSRCAQCT